MLQPLMSSFQTASMSGLLIKEDRTPFQTLPTIQSFLGDLPDDEMVCRAAAKDNSPIPQTKDREYYHGDAHAAWWHSGLLDMLAIQNAAKNLGISIDKAKYFELGCASGRVVRHFAHQTSAEVWCADINLRHAEWVRHFLPPEIRIFNNTAFPYLPVKSEYFNIVSAFSVFTHIDDLELMWMAEIARILAPGGMAYITVSTDGTWEKYKQQWIKDHLVPLADLVPDYTINDSLFSGPLPQEKTVFWWKSRDVYNCTVFHKTDYIKREWGRFLEVKDIIPNGSTYQDVVVLQKRT